MIIYDRLKTIDSFSKLERFNIRRSIKYYFLKMWLEKYGQNTSTLSGNIKDNIKDFTRYWFLNSPTFQIYDHNANKFVDAVLSEYLEFLLEELKKYKTIQNSVSYIKFLSFQLNEGYLLKNLPYFQFDQNLDQALKYLPKIQAEFIDTTLSNDMNELEKNLDIIIGSVSIDDVCYVIAELYLKEMYNTLLYDSAGIPNNGTYPGLTPTLTLNDSYEMIGQSIVNSLDINLVSYISRYADLLKAIDNGYQTFDINNYNLKIYNFVTNMLFGMPLDLSSSLFNNLDPIVVSLVKYIKKTILNTTYVYAKIQYIDVNKYRIFISDFRNSILENIYFSKLNDNEDVNNLSSVFNVDDINTIYTQHNKDFTAEPELFNIAIDVIRDFYFNSNEIVRSNFSDVFAQEKINEFYEEFIVYYIWLHWLFNYDKNNISNVSEDENKLISNNMLLLDYVKENILNNILKTKIYNIEPNEDEIKRIFKYSNDNFKNLSDNEKRNELINNLRNRIDSFKYVRFTLNGITNEKENEVSFYKYLTNFKNTLTQEKILNLVQILNDYYTNLNK